jgi:ABC-type spermidine/putrescine transport system permease subunit II
MNTACPVCGLLFEREPGYFLGAMYYSYAIAIAACAPAALIGWWAGWPVWGVGIAGSAAMLLVAPLGFRFSRVLWLHMDQAFDPR